MLEKILHSIEEASQAEISEIVKTKDKAILAQEESFQEKIKAAREEIQEKAQEDSRIALEEFSQKKKVEKEFAWQNAKNEVISQAYQTAMREIEKSTEKLEKIIVALIKDMPQIKGVFRAGEKTKAILEKHNKSVLWQITGGLKQEGFIFQSDNLEINSTLDQLGLEAKDRTIAEVINILFN